MKNEQKEYIVVDFTGAFLQLIKKLWIIVVAGIVGVALAVAAYFGLGYNKAHVPFYTSTAKLYVTAIYYETPSLNAKTLGTSYMNDYYEIMKSKKVLNQVIEDLGLNMTASDLSKCINKKLVQDTSMMYISVSFPDAELSKAINDDLLTVSSACALEVMGMTPPSVYDESQVPTRPSYYGGTSLKKMGLIGGVAGIALAMLYIVAAYFFMNRVITKDQAEEASEKTLFTAVPDAKADKELVTNSMRYLYSSICALHRKPKTISFVNLDGEKTGEVIKNFAEYAKANDKKVVCVDTNLNKAEWGLGEGKTGSTLVDYVEKGTVSENHWDEVLSSENGIDFIWSGVSTKNSIELLKSDKMKDLIKKLEEKYDYILVNASPVNATPDAKIVMQTMDMNILVVEQNKTKMNTIKNAMEDTFMKGNVSGVVLTNVKTNPKKKSFKKNFGKFMGVN